MDENHDELPSFSTSRKWDAVSEWQSLHCFISLLIGHCGDGGESPARSLGKTALFVENHVFPTFSHLFLSTTDFCRSRAPLTPGPHFAVRTCSKLDHVVWPNIIASQITKHAIAKKKKELCVATFAPFLPELRSTPFRTLQTWDSSSSSFRHSRDKRP